MGGLVGRGDVVRWPWARKDNPEAAAARETAARAWDALLEQLDQEREERRKLLDRMLQMAGQPPIYEPAPAPAPPVTVEPPPGRGGSTAEREGVPAPERRVRIDDVHQWARAQMRNGEPPPRARLN